MRVTKSALTVSKLKRVLLLIEHFLRDPFSLFGTRLSLSLIMFRRCVVQSTLTIRGRPFKLRGSPVAIHAVHKPAEKTNIDFTQLGLTYEMKHDPPVLIKETHWTELPTSRPVELPFFVERTEVSGSLPVYTDIKNGLTKKITILRRCRGDIMALKAEMEKVCDGKEVTVRPGKLVVDGNYVLRVKKWLTGLGL